MKFMTRGASAKNKQFINLIYFISENDNHRNANKEVVT